ncbi:MAG: hypothetical protein JXR56_00620 [Candidatus Cloacimonetes bacterium]|nr:hypothetical protein [Candidatus Cloacimonadota bacterium]
MKKKVSFFSLLIGLGFILWGVSMIVKSVWGIDIPVFKPLLGLVIIAFGAKLIFDK